MAAAGFAILEASTVLDRVGDEPTPARWPRLLRAMERLADLPIRSVTGHFIAVLAHKR